MQLPKPKTVAKPKPKTDAKPKPKTVAKPITSGGGPLSFTKLPITTQSPLIEQLQYRVNTHVNTINEEIEKLNKREIDRLVCYDLCNVQINAIADIMKENESTLKNYYLKYKPSFETYPYITIELKQKSMFSRNNMPSADSEGITEIWLLLGMIINYINRRNSENSVRDGGSSIRRRKK